MKPKTVISLLAVVLVLTATSYFLLNPKSSEKKENSMGTEFMQDLPVNEITSITIQNADSKVELEHGSSVWQVKSKYGYAADFQKISDLVKKLKRLKSGRTFKATDDVLSRQKLYDPNAENAEKDQKGTRIILLGGKDQKLADLILGNNRQTGGTGGSGQYLRFADKDTVYLVNDTFASISSAPEEWLESEIMNITGEEIQSVTCYGKDSDKAIYRLERKEEGQSPQLLSPPPQKKADNNKIDQVFEALAPLNIEDISGPPRAADDPFPTASVRLAYQLYNGKTVTVYPTTTTADDPQNTQYLVSLAVDYNPQAKDVAKPAEKTEKETSKENNDTGEPTDQGKSVEENTEKSAKEIENEVLAQNDKLRIWSFKIAKWQYDSFINTKEGLLETEKETSTQQ